METAQFGATEKGGICRLAATAEDALVRAWFARNAEALGGVVQTDRLGNQFAVFAGEEAGLPAIAMGSHLDTQPKGGKFDGVLGVLAGLEVMRCLRESGTRTRHPLMVVNWTNEEGARFAPAMLASGAYAGVFSEADALAARDRDGVRLGDALAGIGAAGQGGLGEPKFGAMFELHIEQGPILEAEGIAIGAVTGVQGMRWFEVTLSGQDAHTGATPMHLRRDALLGAARAILRIAELGVAHAPGVASVGLLENRPNSRNTVPGEVFFTIDLRHPDELVLDVMEARLRAMLAELAAEARLGLELRETWRAGAVVFDAALLEHIRRGAADCGLSVRDLTSGAGHDAAYIQRVAPTAMIFVPCAGGVSHNEAEYTAPHECANGAQVLLNAVLRCDAAGIPVRRA